jgi:hypothetical protein
MASVGQPSVLSVPRRRVSPGDAALTLRRALGLASLAGLVYCSFVIASSAAFRPSILVPARVGGFPGWLRGPLSDVGYIVSIHDFAVYALSMTGCFLVALLCAPALRARWVIGTVVVAHAIFFLGPPIISADVFGYLDWARMGALHGLNPYSHDSGSVPSDPVYPFVRWDDFTTPYGPLFTLATYALAPLGVPLGLWAIKAGVVGASLGCCALVWACARELDRPPLPAVALYGLNPAVLIYAVGGAHNDVLMMVALLGGVYAVLRGRDRLGPALAASAVAIKASAGLAVPFIVLGARRRGEALVAAVSAGVAVGLVALVAFGTHAVNFINVLGTQQALNSGTSVIAQLGRLGGWQGNPPLARAIASVLFLVVLAGLLVATWRGGNWVDNTGWATFTLMVCTSWLLAWYIVWLVPFAAIAKSRWLRVAAVVATLFVIGARTLFLLD